MSNFRQFDRATGFLLPPSLDEWLPERHLARFVVEVIDGLDLSAMVKSYRGSGPATQMIAPVGLQTHWPVVRGGSGVLARFLRRPDFLLTPLQ
jgi:hypothetical protein